MANTFLNHPSAIKGTAIWRASEVFKEQLKQDKDRKIFNQEFINNLLNKFEKNLDSLSKLSTFYYGSILLLLGLLAGLNLPISFPYIGEFADVIKSKGILEISEITFLLTSMRYLQIQSLIALNVNLIRIYAENTFPENDLEFVLLSWGLDFISPNIHIEDYAGYKRLKKRSFFVRVLNLFAAVVSYLYSISLALLGLFGMILIFKTPSFGFISDILIAAIFILFLYKWVDVFAAQRVIIYSQTKPNI